jgi:dimethylhistidine N-methyltransferase
MKAAAHTAHPVARRAPVAIAHAGRPLIALAFEGLSEEQKELPFVLAYDTTGGSLFERLCEQPEYYLGRAETLLLERHAVEICRWIGSQAAIVEYGAGTARSTPLLLRALHDPFAYVAIDVCAEQLERTCAQLQRRFRSMTIEGVCQDFRESLSVPESLSRARRQVAYLGSSSIGSFEVLEAVELLSSIRETMGPDGGLLIGIDLVKQPDILERAYSDAAGVAAALNLNVLGRLNSELEGTFDLGAFRHRAIWDPDYQRIELSLVSLRAQAPCLAGIAVPLAANETIRTDYAHKYTAQNFGALAHVAGWAVRHAWTEPQNQYSLLYLEGIE